MSSLLPLFQAVSLTFAGLALLTGAHALLAPLPFSRSFGLPAAPARPGAGPPSHEAAYISLMGVRQLTTGLTLLVFAWQGKWDEVATVLSILGVVVAGTDGVYLTRAGHRGKGLWHAGPGLCIAGLAMGVLWAG